MPKLDGVGVLVLIHSGECQNCTWGCIRATHNAGFRNNNHVWYASHPQPHYGYFCFLSGQAVKGIIVRS